MLNPVGPINIMPLKDWECLYDFNMSYVLQTSQVTLPYLRKTNEKTIAVSNDASAQSSSEWSAYYFNSAWNQLIRTVEYDENIQSIAIGLGIEYTGMLKRHRNVDDSNMSQDLKFLADLHKRGESILPEVPPTVIANLAWKSWLDAISGEYFSYDNEILNCSRDN